MVRCSHRSRDVLPAGKELKQSDGSIHPDFRIFATANMHRAHSHKLSSALLNRVIRLWLPALDSPAWQHPAKPAEAASVQKPASAMPVPVTHPSAQPGALRPPPITSQDYENQILSIIAQHFAGVPGQQELSLLATQTHVQMQVMISHRSKPLK